MAYRLFILTLLNLKLQQDASHQIKTPSSVKLINGWRCHKSDSLLSGKDYIFHLFTQLGKFFFFFPPLRWLTNWHSAFSFKSTNGDQQGSFNNQNQTSLLVLTLQARIWWLQEEDLYCAIDQVKLSAYNCLNKCLLRFQASSTPYFSVHTFLLRSLFSMRFSRVVTEPPSAEMKHIKCPFYCKSPLFLFSHIHVVFLKSLGVQKC